MFFFWHNADLSKSYFLPQYSVRESTLEKYKADYEEATDRLKQSMLFFNSSLNTIFYLFTIFVNLINPHISLPFIIVSPNSILGIGNCIK